MNEDKSMKYIDPYINGSVWKCIHVLLGIIDLLEKCETRVHQLSSHLMLLKHTACLHVESTTRFP